MKQHSLRMIGYGLLYTFISSASAYGMATPQQAPVTNATWAGALKSSLNQGLEEAGAFLCYIKLPALALAYTLPEWKITRFWNFIGDTEQAAKGIACSCTLAAISSRYKKQIVDLCGDEETGKLCVGLTPLAGLFLPTKVAAIAGLAALASLQTMEWMDKNKSTKKVGTRVNSAGVSQAWYTALRRVSQAHFFSYPGNRAATAR